MHICIWPTPFLFSYCWTVLFSHLYIIIHRWIWPRAWLTWTVGRGSGADAGGGSGRTTFQTGCRRGRRERGRHGAWLMTSGQAEIERSDIVACNTIEWCG